MALQEPLARRKFGALASALIAASFAGCTSDAGSEDDPGTEDDPGDSSGGEDEQPDNTVNVGADGSLKFTPETLEVESGTTVTWKWKSNTHNIAVDSQPADANWPGEPDIHDTGHEYSYTFDVPGTYDYHCDPHKSAGMTGTVVVQE